MQMLTWLSIELMKDAFNQFRHNPYHNFMVHVRQRRVEQIRALFANNLTMDWETFHSEAWNVESRSFWSSLG